MDNSKHFQALERMYLEAPINQHYLPAITVSEGAAEISIELQPAYHHAAGAVHGSVYFKMLDDAAFFAANSLEPDYFVLTSSFTTYLIRPVSKGVMRSVGRVVSQTKTQFIAESVAYDYRGKEIARGNGIFVRGKLPLREAMGYGED